MKYSLSPREIPRASPSGFPSGSGYISQRTKDMLAGSDLYRKHNAVTSFILAALTLMHREEDNFLCLFVLFSEETHQHCQEEMQNIFCLLTISAYSNALYQCTNSYMKVGPTAILKLPPPINRIISNFWC